MNGLDENMMNPWPYLDPLFRFKAIEGKAVIVVCLLCSPKYTECRAFINSPSNLKKHVARIHPHDVYKYDELTSCARKRKRDFEDSFSLIRPKLERMDDSYPDVDLVSQEKVDDLVTNFVIGGLMSPNIVELSEFKELISVLQSNRTVISQESLLRKIEQKVTQKELSLASILQGQKHVATTVNCWSLHDKCYVGVTAHWIDQTSLDRKSACLTLRRMRGSQIFVTMAAILEDVYSKFGIQWKIVRTTTDNGFNYERAFSAFNFDKKHDVFDGDCMNESDVKMLIMNESDFFESPRLQMCACYKLNLVATVDAENAENNFDYRKIFKSSFMKCLELWNAFRTHSIPGDEISADFGIALTMPDLKKWISVYMAISKLLQIIQNHGVDRFDALCNKLKAPKLTSVEVAFLFDYTSVMKFIVQATNILQSEKKMFMAYLLPTVNKLRANLAEMKFVATSCSALSEALLEGINNRFSGLLEDSEAVAAAILHPKFRSAWTDEQNLLDKGLQYIRHKIISTEQKWHSYNDDDDDDEEDREFFAMKKKAPPETSLDQYLQTSSTDLRCLNAWPDLKELFIRLNTPLPASAAIEKQFKCAELISKGEVPRMRDETFEHMAFCKLNEWIGMCS